MHEKYRDLADGLSEARLRHVARSGGSTKPMSGADWDLLARRIESLRSDLETLDQDLGSTISELAASRGLDPARVKIADLASTSEAEEIRSVASSLREIATRAREEAEANALYFSERISVVEATIQVLADAQRGPAYGPRGGSAPAVAAKGFFEGRA